MIQRMLVIWSLVLLSFLNPACTSGSSLFTYCWSLAWRIFEHYLDSMWNECICTIVWTFFGTALLRDWNENWPFQSCGHCWVFQIWWHNECTLTASSFRIWNSLAGNPSSPLALSVVMLPKAHLTSHSTMSGSRWDYTIMVTWAIKTFFVQFIYVFTGLVSP